MTPEEKQSLQELQIVFSKTGALALADLIENQDRYKAALSSAINPWQPMETAPAYDPGADPVTVLVLDDSGEHDFAWRRGAAEWADKSYYNVIPVRWMPLPELPDEVKAMIAKREEEFRQQKLAEHVASEALAAEAAQIASTHDGCLVKSPEDAAVYRIEGGRKRWIVSQEVFARLGYSWGDIETLLPREVAIIPAGEHIR